MVTAPIRTAFSKRINRRLFLSSAAATTVCTGVAAAPEHAEPAPVPEVIPIGPAERPQTDIEAWNVGLITAYRPELTLAENQARDRELRADLYCFGLYHVRGRYVENYLSPDARPDDVHGYLVIGNSDDSGNLKGFLRKCGRKYDQDAVIHKGYYRDAELYALKDLRDLGIGEKEKRSLGRFHPDRVGLYYTLMAKRGGSPLPSGLEELQLGPNGEDYLGGRWEDIGLWTVKSFFARVERRVYFDDVGNRQKT
jgi:hypothetical protein